jgi:hypothetical protein
MRVMFNYVYAIVKDRVNPSIDGGRLNIFSDARPAYLLKIHALPSLEAPRKTNPKNFILAGTAELLGSPKFYSHQETNPSFPPFLSKQ